MTWQLLLTHAFALALGAAGVAWLRSRRPDEAPRALSPSAPEPHSADDRMRGWIQRFRTAAHGAGMSFWDWDLVRDEVRTDARMINPDIYGAIGDVIDRRQFLNQMLHPDDRDAFIRVMEELFVSGRTQFTHHYRVLRPDGEIAHLKLHGLAFHDERGRAVRLFALNQDVTEQTLIAAKLQERTREQEALLRHLRLANKAAGCGAWSWDIAADCFTADAFISQGLGFGADQYSIRDARNSIAKIIHPDDRDEYERGVTTALGLEGGDSYAADYRISAPNGAWRHVRAHAHIERDASGAAVRMLGITIDTTADVERAEQLERRAAEERALRDELNQQAEKVHTLVDRLSVATQAAGLYVWEMDAVSGRMLWMGARMKTFGLDELPEEEYTDAVWAAIDPDDRAEMMAEARRAFLDGRQQYACRFRMTRDGVTRHMLAFAHIVRDERGRATRLVGATSDITNEVQTTALLQRQATQERELIERLNIATQAAGISSWEIDLAGGRFLWVENPLWGPTEGVDGSSVATLLERIVPEDRDNFMKQMRVAIANKQDRFAYRYRATLHDGSLMHVNNHVRLLRDDSGQWVRALGVSWDVSREVAASEQLERQSQEQHKLLERLKLSTEAANISCWEVEIASGRFTFADESIKALHGVESFSGTTAEFFSRIHPEDRGLFMGAVRDSMANKRDRFSCRYRTPAADGRPIHIQTHVHVIIDEQGHASRLLGVSWDVTKEVERAEQLTRQAQQLHDAERRLERASLSSSEGHWEWDLTSGRLWCSSSYHALLGYAPGELPQTIEEFRPIIHHEDRHRLSATFMEHVKSGAPFEFEARLLSRHGGYRWFRQRGMVERGASGGPSTMAGSIQDIHDQKLAEDALQRARERFERAINGTQDGLWELEHDGAAWCSPRIGELLGYGPDELPSSTNFLNAFLHPDDAVSVASATQMHFEHGAPYDVEIRLRTRRGDYRWYRARASAERDAAGRPLRLSGSLQDVTEARIAREALQHASEAAEAANRAKSEFLANVSHEIRTPLNGVIGMTGLLLDTTLDRTQRDYADTIRTSADSLLMVINDILDFSKIEAGKLDIEALEFDLHGVVEDVGAMMAFQAAAKNLELVVNIHADAPARVIGDPQRVRQCLLNLLGNAIKFTRKGEIVIEARTAGTRDGRTLLRLEVRDTGIGVAPEVLEKLFQPFVQADSSTTRHFGGTGLGLSIVRRLVEMMDGEVGASSEMGKGSSFWFTLPLQTISAGEASDAINLERLGRRVLVVDDNETNRRVLAGQLMHAGYEVGLASGGVEAICLLRQACVDQHPYEVVLADYKMHDMDGDVLGERINGDAQLSSSRLIMLTSMDRQGDVHRFASLGFAAYLTKPVRARELLDCMDRVLARDAKAWHLQSQPIVTRGALVGAEGGRRYDCRVLLVEDNAVNQKVAVRFLERMGCSVRVADNGAEGLKAFGEAAFDIVLMDLQMPVMDGLTAAQRIREREGSERRTPIIALTANAMSGQLERCLAAGMDGFLTKPIEIARLHETLERYGLGVRIDGEASAAQAAAEPAAPVQLARLNEITEGDAEFAHELAMTFIASGEQVLAEIRSAFAAFDRTGLSRGAHKLKGASANIHADPLRDLALRLESQAAQLDQPSLADLIGDLEQEFRRAADFLSANAPSAQRRTG